MEEVPLKKYVYRSEDGTEVFEADSFEEAKELVGIKYPYQDHSSTNLLEIIK